ncbi:MULTISPECIES: hypothetical protein [unclassified Paenibacillus]|uniref:hypothetical protein n=1 Tax=Paenibacillus TaxID=44249 RepID=UPI000CFC5D06|nr:MULTISPECIES: hypothetical protein [unclassified Paenibacillus]PRA08073.1 hypothetical protein CQ043_12145 [Paenibacillus sp. MYb63]PRA47849.1 hypothetical protein CQ061_14685 [Paenibacillus sp. MYb67]
MSDQKNDSSQNPWYKMLIEKLPVSLLFILTIDYLFIKDLASLYTEQYKMEDPLGVWTFIAILALLGVNLIIIIAFAYIRFVLEKRGLPVLASDKPAKA